jgi:hypothetical protein
MRTVAEFRKHAEECRELAKKLTREDAPGIKGNCVAIMSCVLSEREATARRTYRRINLTSRFCRRQKMPRQASSRGLFCNKDTA